jgi:hypothetical protein
MVRTAASLCLLAALVMGLAACSSDSTKEPDPNIVPTNAKQEILKTLMKALADPTNVRDAYMSDPVLTSTGREQRYAACVRYNARDGSRRYTGSTDRIGFFYSGHLNQLVEATKEQCGNAAYKPFPELEKLCQATKCE